MERSPTAINLETTAPDFGRVGLSEEQADLLNVAAAFCREKSPMDKVRALIESEAGYDPQVWREITELGWLGVAIPEPYGGVGLGLAEVAPLVEQMGRAMMATPFVSSTLAAQVLIAAGSEEQKRNYLPKIAGGAPATVAFMEEDGDWDLSRARAEAVADADGYRLTGEKRLVADAAVANLIIVTARLDGAPALFAIERSTAFEGALRRETVIDETKRSYALRLEGLVVPASALLDRTRADAALKHLSLAANLLSAAECCGAAIAVIDYTVDYLKTRKQFGKLIGSYQALKHPIVDAFVMHEQARSHLYAAAHCFNDQGAGEIATRMARATADGALSYAADRAIQFHGGFGFTYDCDAQLYRRRAIWHAALFGDAAHHRKELADLLF